MGLSVVVDDTSLLLLLAIVGLLATSIYVSRAYQPLVHPLLLSRQADVSPVRREGQSAVYRNASTPAGFDLAKQPRRAINSVCDIVALGSGAESWQYKLSRPLYGLDRSNHDVVTKARAFGRGLLLNGMLRHSVSKTADLAVGVCVEVDSLKSLEVSLSGDMQTDPTSNRYAPMVIAPVHLKGGHPPLSLPGTFTTTTKLHALFTTEIALKRALSMPVVDENTLLVFATPKEAEEAQRIATSHKVTFFDDVVAQAPLKAAEDAGEAVGAGKKPQEVQREVAAAIHSVYWEGHVGWIPVSNASLVAGLSAHLGAFPAEAHPTPQDRLYVEQSPYVESPSLRLAAASTPAGLVLPLLALYSGASFAAGLLSSSIADPNPAVASHFAEQRPSIVYASPAGGSILAACLCTVSKRSPLATIAAHAKLIALRHGVLSRSSIWDRLLFDKTRAYTDSTAVRAVAIIGEGPTVGQGLLDIMRAQLGCSVRNMYLPSSPLRVVDENGADAARTEKSGTSTSPSAGGRMALPTAPISATHTLDLQAFVSHLNDERQVPAHVGAPTVTVEVKLVETTQLRQNPIKDVGVAGQSAKQDAGRASDPFGEVSRCRDIGPDLRIFPLVECSLGKVLSKRPLTSASSVRSSPAEQVSQAFHRRINGVRQGTLAHSAPMAPSSLCATTHTRKR